MLKYLKTLIFFLSLQPLIGQNVGIGTTNPDTSAILDLVSDHTGLLIPRLTSVQRANIFQPKQGLLVYQKDGSSGFYYNRSTIPSTPNWSLLSEGENLWSRTFAVNANISSSNIGNVGIGTNNPIAKLHVKNPGYGLLHSDATDNVQLGTYVGNNAGWLGTKSNHPLYFFTNDGLASMALTTQRTLGVGSNTPDTSAIADFISTSKGILLPRTSTTSNITSPKNGMVIYNTSDHFLYLRKNNAWQKLSDDTNNAPFSLPFNGSGTTVGDVFKVTNTSSGRAIQGVGTTGEGVYGSSTSGAGVFGLSISGFAGQFYSTTGTAGYFSTGGTECLVTTGGNVGINTTSPTYFLDINGRTRIRHNVNTAGLWYNKSDNTEATFHGMFNDSIVGYFGNGASGAWKVGFDVKNARLGIGTMTPNMPLSFPNSLGNKIALWGTNASSHYGLGIDNSSFQLYVPSGDNNVRFTFGTGSASNFTELARLEADGQFLVGTQSSTYQAHFRSANAKSLSIENSNTHASNVTNTLAFRTGGWYDALIRTTATSPNTARLGFFTFASPGDGGLLERMSITDDGDILVGTIDESKGVGYKLRVNGKVIAEELKVQLNANWPDYVFSKEYERMSLPQLEQYINKNKHLPNIPAAVEIENNGLEVGEMQRKMMEKIEELTLYLIELKKENDEIKKELENIKKVK